MLQPSLTVQQEQVPSIGLGTWLLSGSSCEQTVDQALRMGYRLIDTAQDYGNERWVGKGIRHAGVDRKQVFLVTKLTPGNYRYQDAIRTTKESLSRLGTDYIDLMLLHWPNPAVPLGYTLDALNKMKEEGYIMHIGLSNYPPSQIDRACSYSTIFSNEIEYHPYLNRLNLIRHARENNYLLLAYSPLAKGRVSEDAVLSGIAKKYRKKPAQVALRWLIQLGLAPIPKASSEKHLKENIEVFDFSLSKEEMQTIENLNQQLHLDPVSDMADE